MFIICKSLSSWPCLLNAHGHFPDISCMWPPCTQPDSSSAKPSLRRHMAQYVLICNWPWTHRVLHRDKDQVHHTPHSHKQCMQGQLYLTSKSIHIFLHASHCIIHCAGSISTTDGKLTVSSKEECTTIAYKPIVIVLSQQYLLPRWSTLQCWWWILLANIATAPDASWAQPGPEDLALKVAQNIHDKSLSHLQMGCSTPINTHCHLCWP